MRSSLFAIVALAACGSSHSGSGGDAAGGGGDGSGSSDASGGGGPASVMVTLTNRPDNAATFSFLTAYQDGSGPWTAAPAPTGDTYTFTINSAAWSFAWTC